MKTVLITGASSGIGLQLAKDYSQQGWNVIACGRDQAKMQAALGDLKVTYATFDMLDRAATAEAMADLQAPDLVILNAGNCEYINNARSFDADLFERVMQTNVQGTVNCLAEVLPKMARGSRLAIVSSSVTFLPLTRAEAYGASKAALDYLARTLAIDLQPEGIDVSLIRPGFVDTPLTELNDFPMPGLITSEQASQAIMRGLERGRAEISFPSMFILTMRLLSWLPSGLWRRIAISMNRRVAQ